MRVIIVKDYEEMSREGARVIARQLTEKPDSVLGMATGSTPVGVYEQLVRYYREGILSFRSARGFNLDEYVGLAADHVQSYFYYMMQNLYDHVDMRKDRIRILNGVAPDIEAECRAYEEAIRESGGIDLQLLGIGRNGHIGFNEPSETFRANTHRVELDAQTCADNARFFDKPSDVPSHALSMGIGSIMRARRILLLASGAGKAQAIRDALEGPVVPRLPASILQFHPDVTWILDEAAAGLLSGDYRDAR